MAQMTASAEGRELLGPVFEKFLLDAGMTAEEFDQEMYWGRVAQAIARKHWESIERTRIGWWGGEMVKVAVIRERTVWIECSLGLIEVDRTEIV